MSIIERKIVLDTNILVAIIGRQSPFRWIFDRIIDGKIALCVTNEILLEYGEVLARKTSPEVAENVINFITAHPATVFTQIYFQFDLVKTDSDDNKFVDCAIAAGAECIVSNDGHFRVLKEIDFPKVQVFTLEELTHQEFR